MQKVVESRIAFLEQLISIRLEESAEEKRTERHLRWLLHAYAEYYNNYRTHLGLTKDTPLGRSVHDSGRIIVIPKLGGLHHAYVRI